MYNVLFCSCLCRNLICCVRGCLHGFCNCHKGTAYCGWKIAAALLLLMGILINKMFVWVVDTVIFSPLATASGLYLDLFLIWIGFKNDKRLKYTVPPPIWHSRRSVQQKPGEIIHFSIPDLNPNKWQTTELINHMNVNQILFQAQHVQIVKIYGRNSVKKENKLDHF